MIDAMTAEALKLRGHRATWLMVLIYPIVFLLFVLVQLLTDMTGTGRRGPGPNGRALDRAEPPRSGARRSRPAAAS